MHPFTGIHLFHLSETAHKGPPNRYIHTFRNDMATALAVVSCMDAASVIFIYFLILLCSGCLFTSCVELQNMLEGSRNRTTADFVCLWTLLIIEALVGPCTYVLLRVCPNVAVLL